jgi:hypothetical protein
VHSGPRVPSRPGANLLEESVGAEIWGKRTGICKGMGGSMHVADLSKGILGANGIVGDGVIDVSVAAVEIVTQVSLQRGQIDLMHRSRSRQMQRVCGCRSHGNAGPYHADCG